MSDIYGFQLNAEEFRTFSKIYNFIHITLLPLYAQSNRQTETVSADNQKYLINNNNQPSPAMLLFSRGLNVNLPTTQKYSEP